MAEEKRFTNLGFSRLKDLVSFPLDTELNEVAYIANAMNFRRELMNKFGNEDYDVDHEIATKPDTNMTYRGYSRFLSSDLRYIFPVGSDRSHFRFRKDVKLIAKEMLKRGDVSDAPLYP
jgi:ATP-binding cassette, subfamily G (WHITE), member 2, PDR